MTGIQCGDCKYIAIDLTDWQHHRMITGHFAKVAREAMQE